MGIQGTEVAKESSDSVIMDDNFASVATVLKWGRCVYNNIQKFIQFQLTVNVATLVINFVAAVSAVEVPLTAQYNISHGFGPIYGNHPRAPISILKEGSPQAGCIGVE
ncbi:unnamed protein product [Prunus armeniaca]